MVRLEDRIGVIRYSAIRRFNSYMVRLEDLNVCLQKQKKPGFNSYMVRLEVPRQG